MLVEKTIETRSSSDYSHNVSFQAKSKVLYRAFFLYFIAKSENQNNLCESKYIQITRNPAS